MIDYLPILTTNLYKVQIFCYQTSNWTIYNNSNGRKPKIKQQIFHFFHKNVGIIRHCGTVDKDSEAKQITVTWCDVFRVGEVVLESVRQVVAVAEVKVGREIDGLKHFDVSGNNYWSIIFWNLLRLNNFVLVSWLIWFAHHMMT